MEKLEDRRVLASWSGTLATNTTWMNNEVQEVTGDVTVAPGVTLTIEPGTIVKFSGSLVDLHVEGTLSANGTAAQNIIFTSRRDDVGGDTNGDGNATLPFNGAWGRINVLSTGTANIDHAHIRYGGDNQIAVDGGSLTLTNSTVSNSSGDGIRIDNADPTLTNNVYQDNSSAAISVDLSSNPTISGVTVSNNDLNGLRFDGGTSTTNLSWTNPDITYVISNDVTIDPTHTLTIGPGQVIKFVSSLNDLFVDGALNAQGTAASPIVFTEDRDDAFGGDTNNDGAATTPAKGNWDSVTLRGTGNSLDHVHMFYGGNNQFLIDGATATITNSSFNESSGDAVRIQNSDPTLTNVTFTDNNSAAVSMDLSSNPVISGVTVANNGWNGLRLDGGTSTRNLNWTNPDITYAIGNDVTIDVTHTLTVGPGQVIKLTSSLSDLFVDGTLDAQGTQASPIVFTEDRDDAFGGDTNNDGAATTPANGNWNAVTLRGTGNILDHVQMFYGGDDQFLIDGATATVSNSSFNNSSGDSVRIQSSDPTLTNVTFTDNSSAAVSMDLSSNPVISGVGVANNGWNGLRLDSGTATRDLFWTNPDITYLVTPDVAIDVGQTLTIEPGQVIKFAGGLADLRVHGTIAAQGTAANPIVLTDDSDDTAGGDSNNDADATTPFNGAWGNVVLDGTNNVLDFVEMRYGSDNQLFIDSATTTITNSTFSNSSGDSIRIENADPTLTGIHFAESNTSAISIDLSSNPTIADVTFFDNAVNGLRVDGGTATKSLNWTNPDITYVVQTDVTIAAGDTLTIAPGQVVKFSSSLADLQINGTLDAQGTPDEPIYFTDDADDSIGGDTNNDLDATLPFRGAWGRINLNATSTNNVMNHTRVAWGGNAMVNVMSNGLDLTNSVVRESSGNGVEVDGGLATLASNLIYSNTSDGITAFAGGTVIATNNTIDGNFRGIDADGAATSVDLTNNLITNHTRSGVFAGGGATVTASFNDVFNPTSSHGNYEAIADPTGTDGNISADPLYLDVENQDYSLDEGSPAVDAANGNAAPEFDFLDNSRVDDPDVINTGAGVPIFADIGALERDRWFSEIISPTRSGSIVAGDTLRLLGTGNASPRPTRYDWDFGDGRRSTFEDPGLVTFSTVGPRTLTFAAVGADGTADPDPDTHSFAVVAGGTPLPDLDVTDIDLPGGLSFGQLTQVNYTVTNIGDAVMPGTPRIDALYLSTDKFLDAGDLLLSTRNVADPVSIGGSYTGLFNAAIPADRIVLGVNYLIVSVDDNWDVLEKRQLNNEEAISTTAAIPRLESGVTVGNAFADSGSGQFYQIDVPAGNNLTVFLNDANDQGINELYARFGALPTRGEFDVRFAKIGADQQLIAPAAIPGTWFLLAFGSDVPDTGDYTIRATTGEISILTTTPDRHGDAADAVMTINGAGFIAGTKVELVNDSGTPFAATEIAIDGFTQITATFGAGTVPPDIYDVRVTSNGASDTITDAFTVVAGGEAVLETDVILPGTLGYHQLATIYVEYANTGDVAMPAPLLVLVASQSGEQKGLMTLDQSLLTRGFWTSTVPDGFGPFVQFLASGETPGVLQPGETGRVPVYWAGWLQPWDFSYPPFEFGVGAVTEDNTLPLDWSIFKNDVQPPIVDDEAWDIIWNNFVSETGNTLGDYVALLNKNASYLGRLRVPFAGAVDLLEMEFRNAEESGPFDNLRETMDVFWASPGIDLRFGRAAPTSIASRFHLGPFGRGWWHIWESTLAEQQDGTVLVGSMGTQLRVFEPDSRGGYFALDGDQGTLTNLGGGRFSLTEPDGLKAVYEDGQIDFVEDTNGNRITNVYTDDQLTALDHSSGASLEIAYNTDGRVERITAPNGRQTLFTYDASGEYLTSVQRSNGQTFAYTYDQTPGSPSLHALTRITFPDGTVRNYSYDAFGRWAGTDVNGQVQSVSLAYDENGTLTLTDDDANNESYFFNQHGALVKSVDASGSTLGIDFDDGRNPRSLILPDGTSWSYESPNDGRSLRIIDPLGQSSTFSYNGPFRRLDSVTDGNGNVTEYAHDSFGNLTSFTATDGTRYLWDYDDAGNPTTWTNRRNDAIVYTWDADGHITSKVHPDGTRADFTYDPLGRRTATTDSTGPTTYTYDAHDRVSRIDYPGGRFLAYTYDAAGRRTSLSDQTGYTLNYVYDPNGRLERLTDALDDLVAQYSFDNFGRTVRLDYGNGTYITYDYDARGRTSGIMHHAPDNTIQDQLIYTYDPLGRRTNMETVDGTWTYTYDAVGQLVAASFQSSSVLPSQQITYEYDAAGNRTRVTVDGVETQYAINETNRYTQIETTTFTYDADGNLTRKDSQSGSTFYTYDVENRLVAVAGPGGNWTYEYDAFGNRVSMTRDGVTTQYVIDPAGLGNVVAEYDGAGTLIAHYAHGAGLVSRTDATNNSAYYGFDGIGSTRQMTDAAGSVVNTYAYDPFGSIIASSETISQSFQFVGQYGVMADGTGGYHMRARYYDPSLGRFVQEDPIGLAGDVHPYRYANNDPVNAIDPSGLITGAVRAALIAQIVGKLGTPPALYYLHNLGALEAIAASLGINTAAVYASVTAGAVDVGLILPGETVFQAIAANAAAAGFAPNARFTARIAAHIFNSPAGPYLATLETAPFAVKGAVLLLTGFVSYQATRAFSSYTGLDNVVQDVYLTVDDALGGWIFDNAIWDLFSSNGAGAQDPNEKQGPGILAAGFVATDAPLPYRVEFENDPSATAPAQIVTIRDPLAVELDPSTFELTEIGFGDVLIAVPDDTQLYETTVSMTASSGKEIDVEIGAGIDPVTGEVFARFVSIDPETGLPPDVLTGFLPPEDDTGRGKGFFSFVIDHVPGLPTGTEIRNIAEIVFDFGTTIATNQVDPLDPSKGTDPNKEALVTIDAGDPTSSVSELPAAAVARDFIVDWSGQDDVGGSGVASYDIFVSENGGAFTPWLLGTTETSSLFTGGVIGSTYGFLSVARDNVGHREAMPLLPDTQTIVGPWANPINVFDVNAVDGPTALDVLLIINELGRNTVSDPDTGLLVELPPQGFAPPFYDVAFDGFITALDALRVINELGRLQGQGEAVGESVDEAMLQIPQTSAALSTSTAPADRSFVLDEGSASSVVSKLNINRFDGGTSATSDRDYDSETAPVAVADPVGEPLETMLQTLAEDVADQWAAV